ncbi:MAG: MucR family transcriptional regulator [Methylobacterium sp.]|uniref:MucR family transcriptional regulator n=1 Tax=Methylobacterium sp. TaxID=409 RepID=UPI0025F347FC|nr:MucR family transcriptional regulator [Methylobacterium sp.]MBX9931505.1 MucR family transcriptional regulator [Methylobacterium sp.]
MESGTGKSTDYIELAADIVSAFVSNNSVPVTELPLLIASVHATLAQLSGGQNEAKAEALTPAVPIKRSITPDYVICLEDGKKFKSLKRHLRTRYEMTPEQYRARWNLPSDYPMVAPNYAAARSALARNMGLGQQRRKSRLKVDIVEAPLSASAAPRGRRQKIAAER